MAPICVGIVGASGETGSAIVKGLIEDGGFVSRSMLDRHSLLLTSAGQDIISLVRPSSMTKPANAAIEKQGVKLRPLDLEASQSDIVAALEGISVLISAIAPWEVHQQIGLADAAKTTGVQRFLPCAFTPVIPAGGVHRFRDTKEEVYNHIKKIVLPYTIMDVGWWYQLMLPRLPSGKIDYALSILPTNTIPGDGQKPSALTDSRDVGAYVARVIRDERTLNKYVMCYNELWTPVQVYDLLEKRAGEHIPRKSIDLATLEARIAEAQPRVDADPSDRAAMLQVIGSQYWISLGIRGDNNPEYAKYLGYVTSKELYPDFKARTFEDFVQEVVDGKATRAYQDQEARFPPAHEEATK